ncbi:UDP-2,3-diacylglucosamine diphosphatase [Hymenobacter psychrotolerans]|uniref:UDP-2,3-diacylglucosamine hydrolase n=1 Tax=Hymenobacter psychrotolerans DSM 18569 TaxID=1121959 RepID=A0A1M6RZX8_9BACT|nr:UDP-2,3-diacylglucosamine diphosphatase [Hymenobacter psychrotolerans]SHK38026.1 UDP-2,3-diacylglucosamine hydrolase [Hymenobacter psychrotolerans DSM 18569]
MTKPTPPPRLPDLALPPGRRVYFASDFHLGAPDAARSLERERRIVRWLDEAAKDAAAIYLLGDIFDFWFEYKHAIPRGFIRLQGKLAELTDVGIPIIFFTGNHDMWMFDYFTKELGIPILRHPVSQLIGGREFHIGHGDGLGPKDYTYKMLKRVFASSVSQWLFARLHPNLGIGIANRWSRHSRIQNAEADAKYFGEDEWLLVYCRELEQRFHHDYYIFGHRHLPLDVEVAPGSRYVNLGEWVNYCSYGVYDGEILALRHFEQKHS